MTNDSDMDGELHSEIPGFVGLGLVKLGVEALVTTRRESKHLTQEIS